MNFSNIPDLTFISAAIPQRGEVVRASGRYEPRSITWLPHSY